MTTTDPDWAPMEHSSPNCSFFTTAGYTPPMPTQPKLCSALVKVQAVLEGAKKTAANPHFKSKYATLEDVWDACRKPLTDHGLGVTQLLLGDADGNVGVTTRLFHESGESIESTLYLKPDRAGPQAAGSAITYARRYGLMAIVGLSPTDDDAEAATERPAPGRAAPAQTPSTKPNPTFVRTYKKAEEK